MFGLDLKSVVVGVVFALFVYPLLMNLFMGMRQPVSNKSVA